LSKRAQRSNEPQRRRPTPNPCNRFNSPTDIAGKTGTTQNSIDGWFILMHPRLVAGAWVGFNDSRVTK